MRRIASEGIDGVRIARIAMDAGVSTSLVHYHFATREALLAEALDYSYAHAGDARIATGELPTALARAAAAVDDRPVPADHSEALREDWVLWVELWLRAVRHPGAASGGRGALRPAARLVRRRDRGRHRTTASSQRCDPDEVADRTLALLDGFGVRTLIGDSTIPLERARRRGRARRWRRDLGLGEQLARAPGALRPASRRRSADARRGAPAGPDRALHVAGHPVV